MMFILLLALVCILGVGALLLFGIIYLITRFLDRPAVSSTPPPANQPEQPPSQKDMDHLHLLAIFHFILGGLALLGLGFLGAHYLFMHAFLGNPQLWKNQSGGPPPQAFFNIFIWVYIIGAVFICTGLVLNVLSGYFLLKRRNRLFSMIVAALNCVHLPLGTALGVFTLIVLCRPSLQGLYRENIGALPV